MFQTKVIYSNIETQCDCKDLGYTLVSNSQVPECTSKQFEGTRIDTEYITTKKESTKKSTTAVINYEMPTLDIPSEAKKLRVVIPENTTNLEKLRNLKLNNVTDISDLFVHCRCLKDISALSTWDISKVTNIAGLFMDCSELEDISPISNWNTSNVTAMNSIFEGCSKLQDAGPLSNWDISKVEYSNNMFKKTKVTQDPWSEPKNNHDKIIKQRLIDMYGGY